VRMLEGPLAMGKGGADYEVNIAKLHWERVADRSIKSSRMLDWLEEPKLTPVPVTGRR